MMQMKNFKLALHIPRDKALRSHVCLTKTHNLKQLRRKQSTNWGEVYKIRDRDSSKMSMLRITKKDQGMLQIKGS